MATNPTGCCDIECCPPAPGPATLTINLDGVASWTLTRTGTNTWSGSTSYCNGVLSATVTCTGTGTWFISITLGLTACCSYVSTNTSIDVQSCEPVSLTFVTTMQVSSGSPPSCPDLCPSALGNKSGSVTE